MVTNFEICMGTKRRWSKLWSVEICIGSQEKGSYGDQL